MRACAARGRNTWLAAVVALLLLAVSALVPVGEAAYRSIFDLPASPVSQQIKAGEPTEMPGARLLDPVANYARTLAVDRESAQGVSLDETTTLNAIALGQASGIPFTMDDISDQGLVRSRSSLASQDLAIIPDDVGAALTLGFPSIPGSLYDLLSYVREYRTRDVITKTARLESNDTLSGLALLANGFAFDPHVLMQYTEEVRGGTPTRALATSRPDPLLIQRTSLPLFTAASAAAAGFHLAQPIDPLALADFVYNNSDRGEAARAVDLPPDTALLGIALKNNNIPVAAEDLLSTSDRLSVRRVDTVAVDYDLADTFSALVVGARAPRS